MYEFICMFITLRDLLWDVYNSVSLQISMVDYIEEYGILCDYTCEYMAGCECIVLHMTVCDCMC